MITITATIRTGRKGVYLEVRQDGTPANAIEQVYANDLRAAIQAELAGTAQRRARRGLIQAARDLFRRISSPARANAARARLAALRETSTPHNS
jgi:hypothetical protein